MKKEQILVGVVALVALASLFRVWASDLNRTYSNLQNDYNELASSTDAQSAHLAELQSSYSDLETAVTLLRADKEALQTQVDELEAENAKLKKEIDEMIDPEIQPVSISPNDTALVKASFTQYAPSADPSVLTAQKGVNYNANGNKETYYNLNMNGVISIAQSQGIEGEYWIREDGVKMYGDYVIVAANLDVHPRGSIVETSLGDGIVLDTGEFAASNPEQFDIATDW